MIFISKVILLMDKKDSLETWYDKFLYLQQRQQENGTMYLFMYAP